MSYPDLPHFAYPFTRTPDGSAVAVVEQDTEPEIMGCELVIVAYPVGFRDDRPEFGWAPPYMERGPVSTDALAQALQEFEDRAPVNIEQVYDAAQATATLTTYVGIRSDSEEP